MKPLFNYLTCHLIFASLYLPHSLCIPCEINRKCKLVVGSNYPPTFWSETSSFQTWITSL